MADLSNLLGDVYGEPAPAAAPEPPAWADESRLDEAFADWTPEPLEPVVARSASAPVSAPLDDDLAAALSAALADAPRPPAGAATTERFVHVEADAGTAPPVLDGATLQPVPDAAPVDETVGAALDAIIVAPPVEVTEPAPKPRRRSLSRSRNRKRPGATPAAAAAAATALEPVDEPEADVAAPAPVPATTAAGRPWSPSDDDILPASAAGRRSGSSGSGRFRLR